MLRRADNFAATAAAFVALTISWFFRWLGLRACRFHPTCSRYAVEALRRFGFLKGLVLLSIRVAKCHPFHPGGHDPLPSVFAVKRPAL